MNLEMKFDKISLLLHEAKGMRVREFLPAQGKGWFEVSLTPDWVVIQQRMTSEDIKTWAFRAVDVAELLGEVLP